MGQFFKAVFLLTGTIIGAGIFALPYSFLLSGFWPSVFGLLALGLLTLILNLFYSRVILKTDGDHQLGGYTKIYFGERWGRLASLAIIFSTTGALFAYIILGGQFFSLIFGQSQNLIYRLLFFCLGATFFLRDFKTLSQINSILTIFLIALALAFPIFGFKFFNWDNLMIPGTKIFAFYGPVLFAFSGTAVIPEVEEVLRTKHKFLNLAVVMGTLIPIIIYFLFGFGVLAISGGFTTVDALSGLLAWSPTLVRIGAGIGLLACLTYFISLGNVLKELFYRDFNWPENWSLFIALVIPFLAVFFNLGFFLKIISLTGTFAVGLTGIIICCLFWRLHQNFLARFLALSLIFVLILGMAAEFLF